MRIDGVPDFVINGCVIFLCKGLLILSSMSLKYFHIRGYLFSNKIRGAAYFVNYFNNGSKNIKISKINLQKKL